MSVINQMLRDLDARGGADAGRTAALAAAGVGTAPHRSRPIPRALFIGVMGLAVVLGLVLVWALWWRDAAAPIDASMPTSVVSTLEPEPAPETFASVDVDAAPPAHREATSQDASPRTEPAISVAVVQAPVPAPVSAAASTPAPAAAQRSVIERVDPGPASDPLETARIALAAGQAEDALSALSFAEPSSADADALRANALQQLGRHTEAVVAYQRALQREPGFGAWWAGLGISLEAEGRSDEALSAYRQAQGRGPLDPALADYLGERAAALSAGEPPR